MPCVADILAEKPQGVFTISSGASVLEAVRKMNQHRIGALVVTDPVLGLGRAGETPIEGMFTERDVLRLVAALQDVCHLTVRDVMTRSIVTVRTNTDIEDVQEIMRSQRVRHLPVLSADAELCGLVSIGDLNAWCLETQARQLHGLNEYIHGRA